MIIAIALAITLSMAMPPAPNPTRLAESIAKRLPSAWGAQRKIYASKLTGRIIIEARRRKIDPLALAAIGWIESIWRNYATRKDGRYTSIGIWQLIRYDSGPNIARKMLKQERVKDVIGARLLRPIDAWFLAAELRNITVSTYVAAVEIDQHRKSCIKRKHRPHLVPCNLPMATRVHLGRLAHFNSGPKKPRRLYLRRLCDRYRILKKEQRL